MTTRDELIKELQKLDEQPLALAAAVLFAMRHDPEREEFIALLDVPMIDAAAVTAWLRAHGWLDPDPVLKLGVLARYTIMQSNSEAAAEAAAAEKSAGWMLDIFMPYREKPSDN